MPRTKIVCTIGPASESPETIRALITSGMNVARLNFSHGNHQEHGERIRIIDSAERYYPHERYLQRVPSREVAESVAHAACILAKHLEASAIVAPTYSGQTARYISRFRPTQPVIALSPNKRVVQRLGLFWGCMPQLVASPASTDDMLESSARSALETGIVKRDDLVVNTAGHPVGTIGSTNMIRVKRL